MTKLTSAYLRRLSAAALLGGCLLSAGLAAAQEHGSEAPAGHDAAAEHGGEHGGEHGAGPHWNEIGAAFVNFAIYAAIIATFARKPIGAFYESRRAGIAQAIDASRKASAEAAAALVAAETRLAGLEQERQTILREAEGHARTEAQRIVAAGHEQAAKIRQDAVSLGEHEARAAQNKFRVRLVNQALAYAQDEISRAMTPDVQARLIDAGIERVGRQPTASQPTV